MDILLGVKFIEKSDKLSNKTYNYIINADILASSIAHERLEGGYFAMRIENANGCRYSDSYVVPVECHIIPSTVDYVRIAKIRDSCSYPNPYAIQFVKEWKDCYVYRKGIDSQLDATCDLTKLERTGTYTVQSIANALSNAANAATDSASTLSAIKIELPTYIESGQLTVGSYNVSDALNEFFERISSLENKEKENNTMFDNIIKNFDFGKAHNVKLSFYGAAFPAADSRMVAFNGTELIDVTGMTFDGDFFFVMPVGIKEVKANDIIKHNGKYVLVEEVVDNRLICLDPFNGVEITVVPAKSPFGFDFVTKLVNIAENFGFNAGAATADAANPFGNLMPFIFMSNKRDIKDLMPLMLMNSMQGGNDSFNPMMLMLMKED